jgi:hypothetical protein
MDNQSVPTNDTLPADVGLSEVTMIVLYGMLILCSLIGNVLVITIVFGGKKLRTNFNYLIVNMAVSDLLIPFIALPVMISREARGELWLVDGPLGNALCKLCFFLIDISPAVSVLTLVIIAVNRFIAIVFPVRVNSFNNRRNVKILILLTWFIAMALFSPFFYTFRLTHENGFTECKYSWAPAFDEDSAYKTFIIINFVILFIIPLISIAVMYSIMLYKIRQSSLNVSTMLSDNRSRRYRDKQILYLSIAIIMAFVLLWGPFYVFLLYKGLATTDLPYEELTDNIVFLLAWTNSVVNPLICIMFNGNFRQGLRRLCCKTFLTRKSVKTQSRRDRMTRQTLSNDSESCKRFSRCQEMITAM